MVVLRWELCLGTRTNAVPGFLNRAKSDASLISSGQVWARVTSPAARYMKVVNGVAANRNAGKTCTADELHYVSVHNSDWRLALWRYLPSSRVPPRNHPLLLLSGVGTNATGYDLSPESSFARFMSSQGFDAWILELRGAGLSTQEVELGENGEALQAISTQTDSTVTAATNGVLPSRQESATNHRTSDPTTSKEKNIGMSPKPDELQSVPNLLKTFMHFSERLSDLLEAGQKPAIASEIRSLSQRLIDIIGGQRPATSQFSDWQDYLSTTLGDFQKQLKMILKCDWDFDHYLEEDIPAAMEYIRTQSKPKDGKLLAIGHSMGGILLYAMLSRCCLEGRDPGLASVTTLASSLDYTTSTSSLKFLLPLAEPAEALNVPVIPIGGIIAAAHPFASYPPYVLSWLTPQISAPDMMYPELYEKLVLKNFCTVPAKLLLQLRTVFQDGGLRDRSRTFFYKDHISKSTVPILALAGDQDLICPPEAVYETVKLIPEHLVTYKVLGEPGGPHYAHYDLVTGKLAASQVYPYIIEFLSRHDKA